MKSKFIFQFLLVLSIGFLAALGCNSSGAAPETINSGAEIEKSNQQRATSASSNGFTIELAKNENDADVLIITMKGLPGIPDNEEETYDLYVCWLDEPGAEGSWPTEKRMERHGSARGGPGKYTFILALSAPFMKGRGNYYGRGRVCAMAASSKASYVSNIVIVPEKPDEDLSH